MAGGGGFCVGAAGSGGMRTDWPAASRVAASARWPSTRTWPVRQSFWIAPWVRPGKCRRNQRSSRISASSSETMRATALISPSPCGRGLGEGGRGAGMAPSPQPPPARGGGDFVATASLQRDRQQRIDLVAVQHYDPLTKPEWRRRDVDPVQVTPAGEQRGGAVVHDPNRQEMRVY